jgi:hypothetical protein
MTAFQKWSAGIAKKGDTKTFGPIAKTNSGIACLSVYGFRK